MGITLALAELPFGQGSVLGSFRSGDAEHKCEAGWALAEVRVQVSDGRHGPRRHGNVRGSPTVGVP